MATPPQKDLTDNQDIFNLNIDQIVSSILGPIDAARSQTIGDGFLESRVNAFYRMIGFPVVKSNTEFYSPGYDVNLNTDPDSLFQRLIIENAVSDNKKLISQQLNPRELTFRNYNFIFSAASGFRSKAVTLGSVFIRSFDNQFKNSTPLEFDPAQTQAMSSRINELKKFYSVNLWQSESLSELISSSALLSNHILKPFMVDPRIQVYPSSNIIAAPFLKDASQLRCFGNTFYKRPYIERVISLRLNDQNSVKSNVKISEIISLIKSGTDILDATLLGTVANPEAALNGDDSAVFDNYFKLIRVIIDALVKNIKTVGDVRDKINFQPIPDAKKGLEGTLTLDAVDPYDLNNREIEFNIFNAYSKVSLTNAAGLLDLGLQGVPDNGSFAFSNMDDIVFSSDKVVDGSISDQMDAINNKRKSIADPALDALKNIEYIMGEFSGLGLIDVVAIQSALWLMDRDKLVGLIDKAAYARILDNRPDLNIKGITRSEDVFESLKDFESKLKDIYSLAQLYLEQVYSGKSFETS